MNQERKNELLRRLEVKKTLNVEELIIWLRRKLHFIDQYEESLKINHIDGQRFFELDNRMMKEIGINTIGHRIRMVGVISKYDKY